MIVYGNIEFHAAELKKVKNGLQLLRIPETVGNTLNERARFVAHDSIGTEIRFVTEAPNIRISLSAIKPEFFFETHDIRVMYGNMEMSTLRLNEGVISSFMLSPPEFINDIKPELLRSGNGLGFAPNVWRFISNTGGLIFYELETFGHVVRPPAPEEKPSRVCLCYGSSITNSDISGYPFVMTRRLGFELMNLGFSGACLCEHSMADWIATECEWDYLILELGVNMLGLSAEEFHKRIDYMLSMVLKNNPSKAVFLLTMFPMRYSPEYKASENSTFTESSTFTEFNEILRRLYEKYKNYSHLYLIEGATIMDDIFYLRADFTHPSTYGHTAMGLRLADIMKQYIPSTSTLSSP